MFHWSWTGRVEVPNSTRVVIDRGTIFFGANGSP